MPGEAGGMSGGIPPSFGVPNYGATRAPDVQGKGDVVKSRTDWNGQWIWSAAREKDRNAYVLFRCCFVAEESGALLLSLTADSFYTLYIDGEWIVRGPARAPLMEYQYDVVERPVGPGRHCIAVLAHHIGEINATVMTGRPGFLADVRFRAAGSEQALGTGPEWKCLEADAWRQDLPCTMSHFGFWEDCDLRRLPARWTEAGFDDRDWAAAVPVGTPPCAPWGTLVERDIPLLSLERRDPRVVTAVGTWQAGAEEAIPSKAVALRARAVTAAAGQGLRVEAGPGAGGLYTTVDFGRTVSGYVDMSFTESVAGACVEISYDDLLGPNSAVNPERSYAHSTDRYHLPGGACRFRTAHPRGFRFLTIDVGAAPGGATALGEVAAWEERYPFGSEAEFACEDPILEGYIRKAVETVRVCSADAFMDCATRERVQWMEDLYMHAHVAAYALGETRLLRRALRQGAQCRLPDGRINGFMPSERTNCAFASSSLVWLHLLMDYWLFSGDEDGVRELLPAARQLLAFLHTVEDEDGLIASWPAGQFWDWAPIEGAGCLLLTNAFYLRTLAHWSRDERFRDGLGEAALSRIDERRRAAHARFWDVDRLLYRDAVPPVGKTPIYSQHANAMAVLAGICPAGEREALMRRVIDPGRLGPVPVGEQSLKEDQRPSPDRLVPVGTLWFGHFLCQALFEVGLDDAALEQMHMLWGAHESLPTFPETRIQRGNTFLCHGWAAGPAYLFPAYVVGVRPTGGGWSTADMFPHPGGIRGVRAKMATPRGLLDMGWGRVDGRCAVKIKAPPGCVVRVK